MRVLVTGAGLVGCHAAAQLVREGHDVRLFDVEPDKEYVRWITGSGVPTLRGDVTDLQVVESVLERERIEAVVHTAALVGQKAERHPALAFHVNAWGTAAVAEAARRREVPRLLHASTLAVYDWSALPERPVPETASTAVRSFYGASKLAAESALRAYAAAGMEVTILRLAAVIGPGHFRGGSAAGALLQKVLERCLLGLPARVPSSLGAHEFLYAADAGRAFVAALAAPGRPGVYNVGSGWVADPADLAASIRAALPRAVVEGEALSRRPRLDSSRATAELGFRPAYDLESAFRDWSRHLRAAPQKQAEAVGQVAAAVAAASRPA